jgi:hypothetical protein
MPRPQASGTGWIEEHQLSLKPGMLISYSGCDH